MTVEKSTLPYTVGMQNCCRSRVRTRREGQKLAGGLLRVDKIYPEPTVEEYGRGREILARFAESRRIEVPSHWNIPQLHKDTRNVDDWNKTKKTVLVLGAKKNVACRPFYRNCDFIAPSQSNGCAMACSYCFVARRKGSANPITTLEAGFEVNVNFGPVILTDSWRRGYAELFSMLDDTLSESAKRQLAAEIIFLTHAEELHRVNLRWHPKGEQILWRPDLQESKVSQASGDRVLRYEIGLKRRLVSEFEALLAERMPYCRVRYAF